MHELIRTTLVFGAVMGITQMSWADVMPVQFDGGGNTSYDGWKDLTRDYYIDYGMGSWPSGISSNPPQIGAAQLVKITGEAYPLNESIYFPSMNLNQNELGGTLAIQDSAPLAGVRTIVLQVKIGESLLHDFHTPSGYPLLKINQGGTLIGTPIAPSFSTQVDREPNGFYDEYPIYINTWAFQWNLDQGVTVDLFQIEFSAVTHAQVYALQLDQTSVLQSQQIFANNQLPPEIKLVTIGLPEFRDLQTFVTHTFEGPPNQTIDIGYSADLASSNWQSKSGVATDDGRFTVTFDASGDQREIWRRRMFFRAKHSTN
jgi:hypothetical protein